MDLSALHCSFRHWRLSSLNPPFIIVSLFRLWLEWGWRRVADYYQELPSITPSVADEVKETLTAPKRPNLRQISGLFRPRSG